MQTTEQTRTRRYGASVVAALVGIALASTGAVAQDYYTSDYVETDEQLYDYYTAGYNDVDTTDDWFYDYMEFEGGTEAGYTEDEWGDTDATDDDYESGTLYDDAGEEGFWDF